MTFNKYFETYVKEWLDEPEKYPGTYNMGRGLIWGYYILAIDSGDHAQAQMALNKYREYPR